MIHGNRITSQNVSDAAFYLRLKGFLKKKNVSVDKNSEKVQPKFFIGT